jgi:hypothetical protein
LPQSLQCLLLEAWERDAKTAHLAVQAHAAKETVGSPT